MRRGRYFIFPETKEMSLEEMDEVFRQSKSVFDPPRIARAMIRQRVSGGDEAADSVVKQEHEDGKH